MNKTCQVCRCFCHQHSSAIFLILIKQFSMDCKIGFTTIALVCCMSTIAQKKTTTFPDSIAPVGIIKNISDSALLDIVQRQTFRFFWHYAHPVSGLARERDNTVHGDYYWDY